MRHPTVLMIGGSFVQAELPDRKAHPVLNALLSKNHKHGPCKQKPCGKTLKPDGRCSKHFPKPWREADTLGPNGSPEYKRRDAAHGGNDMNSMLVAYNWVLSWRYRCHLNVEICSSISSVKYLYKYVCKGHDRVAAVCSLWLVMMMSMRFATFSMRDTSEHRRQYIVSSSSTCLISSCCGAAGGALT